MIEAPILANIGIGTQGIVNGCVYEPSLKFGVIGRFGNDEKAIKATALDLATFKSEGIDLDPIGMFRLKAAKASFRDKLTDQLKEELTLISPDFNNESIAVWTDAGEYGYGTKEDYQRIVSRAHRLAQTEGSASMFFLSPGDESAKTPTPHRAYLWVKKGDDVTAYSYSLAGNRDTLVKMMHGLGYRDKKAEDLEDQTIFQKDSAFSHHDIYQAFTSSLTAHESQTCREFLDKFKKETEVPDSIREEKLRHYKETYEAKLKVNYANDITKALEAAVFGILSMAQMGGSQGGNTAERKEEAKTENVSLGFPPIIIPGLIELTRIIADFPKENPAVRLSLEGVEETKKDAVVSSNSQEAILIERIPKSSALGYILLSFRPSEARGGISRACEKFSDKLRDPSTEFTLSLSNVLGMTAGYPVSLLRGNHFKKEFGKNLSITSASRACARDIFSSSPKRLRHLGDKYFGDSKQIRTKHSSAVLTPRTSLAEDKDTTFALFNRFRNKFGMTLGAKLVKEYLGQVPSSPPADSESFFPPADFPKWEEEIINFGKSILKANSSGRPEDTNQQQETIWKEKSVPKSVDRLVFLLAVYFAPKAKKELKQMVSILIYFEIRNLHKDTNLLELFPKTGLFELLPLPFQPKIIYGLNGGRRKKIPKRLPNVGLIYCKLAGLIYQYQPLVIKA